MMLQGMQRYYPQKNKMHQLPKKIQDIALVDVEGFVLHVRVNQFPKKKIQDIALVMNVVGFVLHVRVNQFPKKIQWMKWMESEKRTKSLLSKANSIQIPWLYNQILLVQKIHPISEKSLTINLLSKANSIQIPWWYNQILLVQKILPISEKSLTKSLLSKANSIKIPWW